MFCHHPFAESVSWSPPQQKQNRKAGRLSLLPSKPIIHKTIDVLDSHFISFIDLLVPSLLSPMLGDPGFRLSQKINTNQRMCARTFFFKIGSTNPSLFIAPLSNRLVSDDSNEKGGGGGHFFIRRQLRQIWISVRREGIAGNRREKCNTPREGINNNPQYIIHKLEAKNIQLQRQIVHYSVLAWLTNHPPVVCGYSQPWMHFKGALEDIILHVCILHPTPYQLESNGPPPLLILSRN